MNVYQMMLYPRREAQENREGRLSVRQIDGLLGFHRPYGSPEKVAELEAERVEQVERERQWGS